MAKFGFIRCVVKRPPSGFEPVLLQNSPLIPKYLGHANH
jgi:hypothetical protein